MIADHRTQLSEFGRQAHPVSSLMGAACGPLFAVWLLLIDSLSAIVGFLFTAACFSGFKWWSHSYHAKRQAAVPPPELRDILRELDQELGLRG